MKIQSSLKGSQAQHFVFYDDIDGLTKTPYPLVKGFNLNSQTAQFKKEYETKLWHAINAYQKTPGLYPKSFSVNTGQTALPTLMTQRVLNEGYDEKFLKNKSHEMMIHIEDRNIDDYPYEIRVANDRYELKLCAKKDSLLF